MDAFVPEAIRLSGRKDREKIWESGHPQSALM